MIYKITRERILIIKYLIKFVTKKEFAEDLLDGKLYMNSLSQYSNDNCSIAQKDSEEASISSSIKMYLRRNTPVYCMYTVEDSDIKNDIILIPDIVIKDFNCENGYLVLIDFNKFEKTLSSCNTDGYQLIGRKVMYGYINFECTGYLLIENDYKQIFIKRPCYKYQKEYRLAVTRNLENDTHIICSLKNHIRDFSILFEINSLEITNDSYIIKI